MVLVLQQQRRDGSCLPTYGCLVTQGVAGGRAGWLGRLINGLPSTRFPTLINEWHLSSLVDGSRIICSSPITSTTFFRDSPDNLLPELIIVPSCP